MAGLIVSCDCILETDNLPSIISQIARLEAYLTQETLLLTSDWLLQCDELALDVADPRPDRQVCDRFLIVHRLGIEIFAACPRLVEGRFDFQSNFASAEWEHLRQPFRSNHNIECSARVLVSRLVRLDGHAIWRLELPPRVLVGA